MFEFRVPRFELLEILKANKNALTKKKKEVVLLYLIDKFKLPRSKILNSSLRNALNVNFFGSFFRKLDSLSKAVNKYQLFDEKYQQWLQEDFKFQQDLSDFVEKYENCKYYSFNTVFF